jgi:endonuclease YncB( thermonuclease family)
MPRPSIAATLALIIGGSLLATNAESAPPFTQQGTVAAIVDPSTLDVRLPGAVTERVQLFGVTAAGGASCAVSQARSDVASLALGKSVWLVGVGGKPGRSHAPVVAYVLLPGGLDLGLELVRRGDATVRTDVHPFKQRVAYLRAQAAAESGSLGLWGCNAPTPATPATPTPQAPASPPGQAQGHGHQGNGAHGH